MNILKKVIIIVLTAISAIVFPKPVYGGEEYIFYYKNSVPVKERVCFLNEQGTESRAFILIGSLIYNKAENIPEGIKLKSTVVDKNELVLEFNEAYGTFIETSDGGALTEQITKTACSLGGLDSIMVCVSSYDENIMYRDIRRIQWIDLTEDKTEI